MKEIKDALENKKTVIGTKEVLKSIRNGKIEKIFLASNCPEEIQKDIKHYAQLSNIEIVKFDGTGKQLGVFCGKPFPIAVLGIRGK